MCPEQVFCLCKQCWIFSSLRFYSMCDDILNIIVYTWWMDINWFLFNSKYHFFLCFLKILINEITQIFIVKHCLAQFTHAIMPVLSFHLIINVLYSWMETLVCFLNEDIRWMTISDAEIIQKSSTKQTYHSQYTGPSTVASNPHSRWLWWTRIKELPLRTPSSSLYHRSPLFASHQVKVNPILCALGMSYLVARAKYYPVIDLQI